MKLSLFKKSSKYGYCKYCGERLRYERINVSFSSIYGSPIKIHHQLVCKNNNRVNEVKHIGGGYRIYEFTTDFNLQSPSLEDFLLFDPDKRTNWNGNVITRSASAQPDRRADKCTNWNENVITKEMYELRTNNRGEK